MTKAMALSNIISIVLKHYMSKAINAYMCITVSQTLTTALPTARFLYTPVVPSRLFSVIFNGISEAKEMFS